jgi:hypothetical protein
LGMKNVENKNEFRITTLSRGLTVAPPSQTEPTVPAAAPAAPAVPTTDTTPVAAVTSNFTKTVGSNAAELLKIREKADTVESAQGGIPLLAILRPYSQLADYIEVHTAALTHTIMIFAVPALIIHALAASYCAAYTRIAFHIVLMRTSASFASK